MAGNPHGSARTAPRVQAELQAPQEAASILAQRYGLSRTTVAKRRTRRKPFRGFARTTTRR